MGDRRSAFGDLDPTVAKLVNGKRGRGERKRPRYPSEEGRVKGTWDLRPETLERIKATADSLGVAQYALVEKAINDWLDLYEAGDVELKKVAVVTSWGLE